MRKLIATGMMAGLIICGLGVPAIGATTSTKQDSNCNKLYKMYDFGSGKMGGYYKNCKLGPVYLTYHLTSDKPGAKPQYVCFKPQEMKRLGDYDLIDSKSLREGNNCWTY